MGRIIFLNSFPKTEVSGGIKTTYRHADLLSGQGFDVQVLQPDGVPPWLEDSSYKRLVCRDVALQEGDVAVFPETLNGWFGEAIKDPWPCKKVIFCQNPYYLFFYCQSGKELEEWGVERVIVPSEWTKKTLQSILGIEHVDVVPPIVEIDRFVPLDKELRIVSAGWKWDRHEHLPAYDGLIQKIFKSKYPTMAHIPWSPLTGLSEREVAETMGRSMVCLSLGRLESLGMTALEAMSAGCLVVGFHGGGGLDYATSQNGFWHSPEDLEAVVDSLALALEIGERQTVVSQQMKHWGWQTAQFYNEARTKSSLKDVYSALLERTL